MNMKIQGIFEDVNKTEVFKQGTMNTLAQVGFMDHEKDEAACLIIEAIKLYPKEKDGGTGVYSGVGVV